MKKILSYTLCCMLLLLGMAACIDDEIGKNSSGSNAKEVTLRFSAAIPALETVNTRSVDPDGEAISMMWLLSAPLRLR